MATLPTPYQIQIAILKGFRAFKPDIRPNEIIPLMSLQLLLNEIGITNQEFSVELNYLVEVGEVERKQGSKFVSLTGKGFARMPDDEDDS